MISGDLIIWRNGPPSLRIFTSPVRFRQIFSVRSFSILGEESENTLHKKKGGPKNEIADGEKKVLTFPRVQNTRNKRERARPGKRGEKKTDFLP